MSSQKHNSEDIYGGGIDLTGKQDEDNYNLPCDIGAKREFTEKQTYEITRDLYISFIRKHNPGVNSINILTMKSLLHKAKEAAKLFIENYDEIEDDQDIKDCRPGI